jgi:DNA repair protein RecO (recombination protein O)
MQLCADRGMEWSDDAIVLSVRAHGESSAILEALTRQHGRHAGLVRGGTSRKSKAALQPGNSVHILWRARLNEHLGNFTAEPMASRAGHLFESRAALAGLNAFCAVTTQSLPEREKHQPVFEAGEVLLDAMTEQDFAHWGPLYVRWELGVLEELGFGLDLSECAATGQTGELEFVSPKSGRAVSRAAAAPYKERLLALPAFLQGPQNADLTPADIAAGLKLTGYFLLDRVWRPNRKEIPAARLRLEEFAHRESE